jgi:hypothetical protein
MKQKCTNLFFLMIFAVSRAPSVILSAQETISQECGITCESTATSFVQTDPTMLALGYSMILIGFGFLVLNLQISAILEKRG